MVGQLGRIGQSMGRIGLSVPTKGGGVPAPDFGKSFDQATTGNYTTINNFSAANSDLIGLDTTGSATLSVDAYDLGGAALTDETNVTDVANAAARTATTLSTGGYGGFVYQTDTGELYYNATGAFSGGGTLVGVITTNGTTPWTYDAPSSRRCNEHDGMTVRASSPHQASAARTEADTALIAWHRGTASPQSVVGPLSRVASSAADFANLGVVLRATGNHGQAEIAYTFGQGQVFLLATHKVELGEEGDLGAGNVVPVLRFCRGDAVVPLCRLLIRLDGYIASIRTPPKIELP